MAIDDHWKWGGGVAKFAVELRVVVVGLLRKAGVWRFEGGRLVPPRKMMPRSAWFGIDAILTSAEAALRRLIVVVAAGLEDAGFRVAARERAGTDGAAVSAPPADAEPVSPSKPRNPSPAGASGLGTWRDPFAPKQPNPFAGRPRGDVLSRTGGIPDYETGADGRWIVPAPRFALFDPRRNFDAYWRDLAMGDAEWLAAEQAEIRRLTDAASLPSGNAPIIGMLPSAPIVRRMLALLNAVDNLEGEAKRYLAILARPRPAPPQYRLTGAVRPGYAPGWRKKKRHDIDHILRDCHLMAADLLAMPRHVAAAGAAGLIPYEWETAAIDSS